jgi:hypothetical protein
MENKQSMKVSSTFSEDIVKIAAAHHSFIDLDYFKDAMGEVNDKDDRQNRYNSYPVKIECLEIGWIIQKDQVDEVKIDNMQLRCKERCNNCFFFVFSSFKKKSSTHGLRFMTKLHESQNLDLYEIPAVKMLIEYFYDRYKTEVLWFRSPVFFIALISFLLTIYVNEYLVQACFEAEETFNLQV